MDFTVIEASCDHILRDYKDLTDIVADSIIIDAIVIEAFMDITGIKKHTGYSHHGHHSVKAIAGILVIRE
jgi:hypothetical protein